MKKSPALGDALMDLALVGAIVLTIGVFWQLISDQSVPAGAATGALLLYGLYIVIAVRLGSSPKGYFRNLLKRRRASDPLFDRIQSTKKPSED